ncbi:hypothetical protein V865_003584 [Kwoniella europaea PYCC6329]|uniref:Uncharacterized protein n=1 Tax=Kwoniella europaea PYCC6329 TaxID=1423913 RepID=A0AAX4KGQ1_9TREE
MASCISFLVVDSGGLYDRPVTAVLNSIQAAALKKHTATASAGDTARLYTSSGLSSRRATIGKVMVLVGTCDNGLDSGGDMTFALLDPGRHLL